MQLYRAAVLFLVASTTLIAARQDSPPTLQTVIGDGFQWRNLGPFRAGAWISDIAVPESPHVAHRYTFYAAARTGGVWKTTNNGTTFQPVFDDQGILSIGALAIAPSNPDIIWVGTGDAFNARSSYSGDGVHKSIDGGRTWQRMGLTDSHHIARIVIHPRNPDVVYVAAMGHLFTKNGERGVFKTTDAGRTWKNVLYINDVVGAIDLVITRRDPRVLYAAAYEKERRPWMLREGGPGSGIYRSTDGGTSWTRLRGGLPDGPVGRIGLDIHRANPKILYAVVENLTLRAPTDEEAKQDRDAKRDSAQRPIGNEVYRTDDGGNTWRRTNQKIENIGSKAAYSFNQIRVDPRDDRKIFLTSDTLVSSIDGGRTWRDTRWPPTTLFKKMFGDVRTLWIDPENPNRMILGSDGALFITHDGGVTCDSYTNLPLGEVYALAVDMEDPYHIYAGLQDHESWRGPVNSWSGRVSLEDWVTVGTGDGMYNQVDPTDSRWLYNTLQFGFHHRVDQVLRTRTRIMPAAAAGEPPLRFNWVNPIRLSPHNSQIIHAGSQRLHRSLDRGDTWQTISPDLTTNDQEKIALTGPNIRYATITTISESPVTPGIIWVGTDDGRVHVTKDHGATWIEATAAIARLGGPANYWVSRVVASPHAEGTAYVAKTGFREDDFRPFLYRTTDFGATWSAIAANLPDRPINVVIEGGRRDLLFVGNDHGVYVSMDAGRRWIRMNGNMPPAPVHDLVIHPRERDLVAGTYGRGIFVTDIRPLEEMSEQILEEDAYLFDIESKPLPTPGAWGNYHLYGDRPLSTPNEPAGFVVTYYLKHANKQRATAHIADLKGKTLRTLDGPAGAGLNRLVWNMQDAERHPVPVGEYVVTIEVAGRRLSRSARIRERIPPRGLFP